MFLNYLLVLSIHSLSSLGITPNSSPWVICLHSGWLPNKLPGSVFISYHPSSLQHFSLQCSSVSQQRLTHAPTARAGVYLFILPAPNSSDTQAVRAASKYWAEQGWAAPGTGITPLAPSLTRNWQGKPHTLNPIRRRLFPEFSFLEEGGDWGWAE